MASPLARLTGAALDATRRALHDLDADQVPADLRKVAAHSGALPPPLAGALLRGLDRYDWLREKALEAWPEGDRSSDDPSIAFGLLFLERPPGWSEKVAAAVAAAAAADASDAERRAEARIAELEETLDEARRRLRDERRRAAAERERLERARDAARAAVRAVRSGEGRSEAQARRRAEEAETRAAEAEAGLAGVGEDLASLRDKLAEERRRRAEVEHALAEAAAGRVWVAGDDPVALAAHLDDVARMARPLSAVDERPVEASNLLRLPSGVAPDSPEAVVWLLERRGPTTVIVDGYNAGFELAGPGDPAAARRRLQVAVGPLPRVAAGPLQVVIVYDSTIEDDDGTAAVAAGRVVTRFAAAGRSADDEIVALAGRHQGPVVVISGDRAVREGAEAEGALTLWSKALAEWSTRR